MIRVGIYSGQIYNGIFNGPFDKPKECCICCTEDDTVRAKAYAALEKLSKCRNCKQCEMSKNEEV